MPEQLSFAFSVTGPILVMLALGKLFHWIGLIDNHFIATANRLVFNVTLPVLLFFSTVGAPLDSVLDLPLVMLGVGFTCAAVGLLWWGIGMHLTDTRRGVLVQGAFRGNMAIIGLALVINAFGDAIAGKAAIYLAILAVLYNLLSIWLLSDGRQGYLRHLARNPLIMAIFIGVAWSLMGIPMPRVLQDTGQYVATITLPLALLCVGGSLHWGSFRANHSLVLWISALKLVVLPAGGVAAAVAAGFRGPDLGLLFLMMAAPTATASYVMARQMTGHGQLAAEIVVMTNVGSVFTITLGLALLRAGQFI